MVRRTALDIKKEILDLLKQKEMSLRELESKVDTNFLTIKNNSLYRNQNQIWFVLFIHLLIIANLFTDSLIIVDTCPLVDRN